MASIFGVCCWYILYHKDKIGDIDTLVSYPLYLSITILFDKIFKNELLIKSNKTIIIR